MGTQNKSPQHVQRVRAIWRRVREQHGWTNVEFARELSKRLGFNVAESSVSRWIEGKGEDRLGEVPSADKHQAVLEMGGFELEPGEPADDAGALRQELADMRRQMQQVTADLQAMQATQARAAAVREEANAGMREVAPLLPRAVGPGFLSVSQAASRKGCSRQAIYRWISEGKLQPYRGRGTTVVVRTEDLDALEWRG